MTWIKICGTTNLEDALVAVDAGVDAVGFVFYEKSPRSVDVESAREIVEKLPAGVEKVGVFVNEAAERISSIADAVKLTAVQFHGDEYENPAKWIIDQNVFHGRKIFLCVPANWVALMWRKKGKAIGSFMSLPDKLGAIVVDSGTREERGGTGKPFDWGEAQMWVSLMNKLFPVAIAGGLTPGNVGEAIRVLKPWGVDVASGVEARPGKKDPAKVRAFVNAVREIDKKAS